LAGVAHEIEAHGPVGRLGGLCAPAGEGDRDGRLLRLALLRDRLERLHIRLLRIGDGIEIDRPDVALRGVGIGLRPEIGQRSRQVFCLGGLVFDDEGAAAIAFALGGPGIDRIDDGERVVPDRRRCARIW
jgi:hypothetical protein